MGVAEKKNEVLYHRHMLGRYNACIRAVEAVVSVQYCQTVRWRNGNIGLGDCNISCRCNQLHTYHTLDIYFECSLTQHSLVAEAVSHEIVEGMVALLRLSNHGEYQTRPHPMAHIQFRPYID